MNPTVTHKPEAHRYELFLGDERVGLMDYELRPGEIHLVHTEVNREHRNKNFAAILLRESLADIRLRGTEKVVPVCSYTVVYMEKHPETQDLLLNPIEDAIAACRLPASFFERRP
jgi:predicted GNAT family acetyltransferase